MSLDTFHGSQTLGCQGTFGAPIDLHVKFHRLASKLSLRALLRGSLLTLTDSCFRLPLRFASQAATLKIGYWMWVWLWTFLDSGLIFILSSPQPLFSNYIFSIWTITYKLAQKIQYPFENLDEFHIHHRHHHWSPTSRDLVIEIFWYVWE